MSFINTGTTTVIRAKLTDTGRKLLAQGKLTYDFWVFGDSEIDYGFNSTDYSLSDNKVLAPKDKNYNVKYPIPSVGNGDIFNALTNTIPIEQLISNKASTRGLFTGSTNDFIFDRFKGSGTASTAYIEGGNSLNIAINSGNISVGDILIIQVKNSTQSGGVSNVPLNMAIPYLTYKVKTTNGTTGAVNVTVDRALPFIDSGSASCAVLVIKGGDVINNFYGSGTTTTYWNYNTLSFENNCNCIPDDVPVWNFNIVYTENLAGINTSTYKGIDKYPSKIYNGFKEYLNYTSFDKNKKSIGIIHYTNNTIANYYGENLKKGTFKISMPTILWHRQGVTSGTGNKIGLVLSAQTQAQTVTTNSSTFGTAAIPFNAPYDNLVDNNGFIVGKVFNELKIAVIEDEELVAAMAYKSNRNWTLPTLEGSFISAVTENQGLIGSNEEVYVSYLLANNENYGYTTGLHCQNYKKINRGGQGQNNIKVNFPANQLPFLKENLDTVGGFNANKLFLLVQKVTVGQRPSSTNWKKIDVTSTLPVSGSGRLNPVGMESTSFNLDLATYNASPIFDLHDYLNVPTLAENDILSFGEEYVFLGNVDSDITATTYKTSFIFPALSNQFKTSVNPTYNVGNNDTIFISEVGVYNSLKQLVAIGKLSNPIKKRTSNNILIQLEIDF